MGGDGGQEALQEGAEAGADLQGGTGPSGAGGETRSDVRRASAAIRPMMVSTRTSWTMWLM